jgi:signal transduction histidine kinase
MSDPVWYRSLYWRIAIGFIALLAVLLLVQSLLFLWLTDRFVGSTRTPAELAGQVAAEVAGEIEQHPDLALEAFIRNRYSRIFQPFIVVLSDGRRGSNRPTGLPPEFGRFIHARMKSEGVPPPFERRGGGGPRFPIEFAPILVHGSQVGLVAVPSNPPPVGVALRELGPTLTWFGLGLLGVGATLTALLIFRPAHKRLRTLEQAARALGEGRTDVRATETGGDEVSSLARTFNRMAIDLDSRAAALTQSDRARRQLLADVSHELMTPLSAIRGYVETLGMSGVPLDQETRTRYLGIVEQETHKLEAIIGDLLDLARLEGGGDKLRSEPVSVSDLFTRVSDRHQPAIRDRGITLDFDIAAGTPNVLGDAARLEQALQNLAANAIRHTPSGGRVSVQALPADGGAQIVVRDTGPGIPTEHLPRVFDRFYKVDAARAGTAEPSGSGLGLSIVRAIVERHGGTVTAANAPEGGAVFELRLPAGGATRPGIRDQGSGIRDPRAQSLEPRA